MSTSIMKKLHNLNSSGMASITVTVVFIMVISLIVLGFSQVTRRNSKETLDKQLSSQAFYAAEVGINDARNKIANLIEQKQPVPDQETCKGSGSDTYNKSDGVVDVENNVSYSCLLVKTKLPDNVISNLSGSVVMPLSTEGDALIGSPMLEWSPATQNSNKKVADCAQPNGSGQIWTKLPNVSDWNEACPFGLLRIDIMPTNDPSILKNVDTALSSTATIFIYPKKGDINNPPVVSYSDASGVVQGKVVTAACSDTICKLQLSGLDWPKAYLKIRSIYANTQTFKVNAMETTVGEAAYDFNSQIQIDATGKAQDVLRRLQARISAIGGSTKTDSANFSDYALQSSDSICKRFVISPTVADNASGCN